MTAALEGSEWSAARPGRTLPPGKTRYPFYRRLVGPQGRSGPAEKLVPTGIRSPTVQPVVSRYTDWAIRPTQELTVSHKSLACHMIRRFITAYTKARHWTLNYAKNQSTPSQPHLRSTLILYFHLRRDIPSSVTSLSFQTNIQYAFYICSIRATCTACLTTSSVRHCPLFHNSMAAVAVSRRKQHVACKFLFFVHKVQWLRACFHA